MALTKVTSGMVNPDPTNASNLASGSVPAARLGNAGTTWQAITTGATLTAVAGNGYPINTTSNACTVTLPASASVGDTIEFVDYAGTWDTNAITLDPQSLNLKGATADSYLVAEREGLRLVYVDATQGWVPVAGINVASPAIAAAQFVAATGPDDAAGVTDGDYKYHIFTATKTGSNGFSVSNAGNSIGSNTVEYLVTAGGGGGGGYFSGGGGGAGGYRCSVVGENTGGGGSAESALSVSVQDYNITVGSGGTAGDATSTGTSTVGGNSIFDSITSTGGGRGGTGGGAPSQADRNAGTGGSGGGGGGDSSPGTAGAVASPTQGYVGGAGVGAVASYRAGGGGGAGVAGGTGTASGDGGNGLASSITGSSVSRGGGGGGGSQADNEGSAGSGGGGIAGAAGTVNTGGGGGGVANAQSPPEVGWTGGSGVVIIRYKFQ